MFVELLATITALEIGPFYEQRDDFRALRPLWSQTAEETDVLWPLFTRHRDWWRFAFFIHEQDYPDGGWQFEVLPLWFNGRDAQSGSYWGFFPFWGRHPHLLGMYDLEFCCWPLWMRYRIPRPQTSEWLETKTVLFPFVSWRSDGSWSVWPFYGISHNRDHDHRYVCWPFYNAKVYREDRDTGGRGRAWMLWPFYGRIDRVREQQTLVLPPFFSWATTPQSTRLRAPWPFFEWEHSPSRDRLSVFPFYERIVNRAYGSGRETGQIVRFGWRLVEFLPGETRVFPFYVRAADYFRLWPFWEAVTDEKGVHRTRLFSLLPLRFAPAVDRNWAKFWTFYEAETEALETRHSLFWGLIRWRTKRD